MKLFKIIDDKFAKIGFIKVKEDKPGISYARCDKKYNFTQYLDILYKEYITNIIQSYDLNLKVGYEKNKMQNKQKYKRLQKMKKNNKRKNRR